MLEALKFVVSLPLLVVDLVRLIPQLWRWTPE
jgi:hypothetical protein